MTGWKYSPMENRLYETSSEGWLPRSPTIERRGCTAFKHFNSRTSLSSLPNDSVNTVCLQNRSKVTMTGWAESLKPLPSQQDLSFEERMLYGPADRRWVTRNAVSIDNGKYVVEAIGKGEAIAVSDGSFKNNHSAAACIIEDKIPGLNSVSATAITPGNLSVHDPYRGELTGIYATVVIVNELCQLYNITEGKVVMACDGIEALKKAMGKGTHHNC
eukprot:13800561-Ditylum_brightwellii.AAC.1